MKLNWVQILSIVVAGLILITIQALVTKKVNHCSATGHTSEETIAIKLPGSASTSQS